MPNPGADAPLRKVTLNLYEADVRWAKKTLGPNWTVILRDVVHKYLMETQAYSNVKRTLGDLE